MIFGESFQEPSFVLQSFRDYGGGSASVSGSQVTLAPNSNSSDEKLIWTGGSFSKGTVSVQILRPSANPGTAGFILNVQNPSQGPDQFFGYEISLTGSQLVIGRHRDQWEPLASYPCTTPTDQWIGVVVQFEEDAFQISVNGTLVATYVDQQYPLAAGMIGLRSFGGNASFQQLSLQIGSSTTQVPFVAAAASPLVRNMWDATPTRSSTGGYFFRNNAPFVRGPNQQLNVSTRARS